MNCNNYQKVVHALVWFDDKIMLSKRLKKGFHQGYWSDAGGKVEKDESIGDALLREMREETGLGISSIFELVDCFIYHKREIKTFLFVAHLNKNHFKLIKNPEPDKQSDWELFTIKQALNLKLMPSVKFYLENLNRNN